MKTINILNPTEKRAKVFLHDAVDELLRASSTATKENKVRLINNISSDVSITHDYEVILTVVHDMLAGLVANASDTTIYISAKELYGTTMEIKIKDENCFNTYAVAVSLQTAVPLAEKIGGHLDITNQKQKITTIEFRFPLEKEEVH